MFLKNPLAFCSGPMCGNVCFVCLHVFLFGITIVASIKITLTVENRSRISIINIKESSLKELNGYCIRKKKLFFYYLNYTVSIIKIHIWRMR